MARPVSRPAIFVAAVLASLALLTGTAGALTETVTLSPTSLSFTDQPLGSTSGPQGTTLTLHCSALCNFSPSIATSSSAFAAANGCPVKMTADFGSDTTCTISVTFTPAALGPANGTLDTGPGGPTATLSGTGVPIEPHVARKCKKGKKHSARSAKRKKCKKKGKR